MKNGLQREELIFILHGPPLGSQQSKIIFLMPIAHLCLYFLIKNWDFKKNILKKIIY